MPLSDYTTFDPEFSDEQEAQCARLVGGVREINERVVRLSGSVEELSAAADRVEALLDSLGPVTQSRAMESFRYAFDAEAPNDVIPFNPATGEFNPIAPAMKMTLEDEKLIIRCTFTDRYESGPDMVQGGMVAAVYDQLMAYAVMAAGATGPTLSLKVSYLKPTPIHEELRFEAVVESIEGKKFVVKASCHREDLKLSEAEALVLRAMDLPRKGDAKAE
jgi:acyl-coenzyme A thioesterase PaaI-like protein